MRFQKMFAAVRNFILAGDEPAKNNDTSSTASTVDEKITLSAYMAEKARLEAELEKARAAVEAANGELENIPPAITNLAEFVRQDKKKGIREKISSAGRRVEYLQGEINNSPSFFYQESLSAYMAERDRLEAELEGAKAAIEAAKGELENIPPASTPSAEIYRRKVVSEVYKKISISEKRWKDNNNRLDYLPEQFRQKDLNQFLGKEVVCASSEWRYDVNVDGDENRRIVKSGGTFFLISVIRKKVMVIKSDRKIRFDGREYSDLGWNGEFHPEFVHWATDSLSQFSNAELAAVEAFTASHQ